MGFELVALDLDGSLLTTSQEISPRVKGAVAATLSRGVAVTLATGRRLATTIPFARELGLTAPLIVHNGAVVTGAEGGALLHELRLASAATACVLRELKAAGLGVFLYEGTSPSETIFYDSPGTLESMKRFYFEIDDHLRCVGDLSGHCTRGAIRLISIGPSEATRRALERLNRAGWDGRVLAWPDVLAGEVVTEFQHRETSKGTALRALARALGVPREKVLAIGDHVNDLEMLREAGMGVAMGNALPEVRAVAGWVTRDCDHDGVAWALEALVLGRGKG